MAIYVPSMGRANKIITDLPDQVLVVPRNELSAYRAAGHPQVIAHPKKLANIGEVRQWIIDNADDDVVIMCDDDVKFFVRTKEGKLAKSDLAAKVQMLDELYDAIEIHAYGIASVGMRLWNNARPEIQYFGYCHTIWAVDRGAMQSKNIRIPKECGVCEDLAVLLALITNGYSSIIFNKWAQESGAGQDPGGCAVYRTAPMHTASAEYLAKRYPKYVKINYNAKKFQHNVRVSWKKLEQDYA